MSKYIPPFFANAFTYASPNLNASLINLRMLSTNDLCCAAKSSCVMSRIAYSSLFPNSRVWKSSYWLIV